MVALILGFRDMNREPHREYIPLNLTAGAPETTGLRRARISLGRAIQHRRNGITHLRALETAVVAARHAYAMADGDRVRVAAACTAAREAEAVGRRLFEESAVSLFDAYRGWQAKLIELVATRADALKEAFNAWLERRIGVNPLRLAGEAAHRDAIARLSSDQSRIKTQLDDSEQICGALLTEIVALEQGVSPSYCARPHWPASPCISRCVG